MASDKGSKHFEVVPLLEKHAPYAVGVLMTPPFAASLRSMIAEAMKTVDNKGMVALVCAIEGQLGRMSPDYIAEPQEVVHD